MGPRSALFEPAAFPSTKPFDGSSTRSTKFLADLIMAGRGRSRRGEYRVGGAFEDNRALFGEQTAPRQKWHQEPPLLPIHHLHGLKIVSYHPRSRCATFAARFAAGGACVCLRAATCQTVGKDRKQTLSLCPYLQRLRLLPKHRPRTGPQCARVRFSPSRHHDCTLE